MRLKVERVKWITEHLKKINMSSREISDAKTVLHQEENMDLEILWLEM